MPSFLNISDRVKKLNIVLFPIKDVLVSIKRISFFTLLLSLYFVSFSYAENWGDEISKGVYFSKITMKKGPVTICRLRIDLSQNDIDVSGVFAHGLLGAGLERTSDMIGNNKSRNIIAAVNADFFGGRPPVFQNSMIVDGQFVKGACMNRTSFMCDAQGNLSFNKFKFFGYWKHKGDSVVISELNSPVVSDNYCFYNEYYRKMPLQKDSVAYLCLKPLQKCDINEPIGYVVAERVLNADSLDFSDEKRYLGCKITCQKKLEKNDTITLCLGISPEIEKPVFLIGGLPRLIENGRRIKRFEGREGLSRKGFWADRHPRTAIGVDRKKNILFLVVVDGRQNGYSIGMTLSELAKYMKSLGCQDALNLDGGGSSTMIINHKIVNSPSDKTGERKVANAFTVIKRVSPRK